MNILGKLLVGVVLFLVITVNAKAQCRKVQICDDYGMNCQVRQVCSNTFDLPSVEVDPITPLPSTKIKPLPPIGLPPLGTGKCEYRQVNGIWQNVCE
ncbi:MAG: hypothetical protein L3J50_13610 [Emcibacter sp.]|nr:hypothetical protein [Emcibacter sp.]